MGGHLDVVLRVSNEAHNGYFKRVHELFEFARSNGSFIHPHADDANGEFFDFFISVEFI